MTVEKSIPAPLTRLLFGTLLVAANLLLADISPARHNFPVEGDGIDFHGESQFLGEARALLDAYPDARAKIETALGWEFSSRPGLLLLGNREAFRRMAGNPLVTAFAVPKANLVVIHVSPATGNPYLLRETFIHELCHLLLHEHIDGDSLPLWLDEGVCQWVSGSLGEIAAGEALDTSGIDIARHPIPMTALENRFPDSGGPMLQAYAQSRSLIEYVVSLYGRDGLQRILQVLKEGHRVDQAIGQATGISYGELEQRWLHHIRGRSVRLIWASQHLYDILFFAGALLTIIAFARLWARKRRHLAEDDDTDEGSHPHKGDLA